MFGFSAFDNFAFYYNYVYDYDEYDYDVYNCIFLDNRYFQLLHSKLENIFGVRNFLAVYHYVYGFYYVCGFFLALKVPVIDFNIKKMNTLMV